MIAPKRSGNSGQYLSVLNCASENGLSLETCGRLWVLVPPTAASRSAPGLRVLAEPRSACRVSAPGVMPWRVQVSPMSRSASAALSRGATILPTPERLHRERIPQTHLNDHAV